MTTRKTTPRPKPKQAHLRWSHQQLERRMAGPTGLGLDRGAADYLLVTNTGTAPATALTFTAVPSGLRQFSLRRTPEPFDLPVGGQASWSLVRARGGTLPGGSSFEITGRWLQGDTEHQDSWVVVMN